MKFKEVVLSDASTEAKVAALGLLLDKELLKLADLVFNVKKLEGPKGEEGIQGAKGDQGDRGFDGTNGTNGRDGVDGLKGDDGSDGVGVADARIDFDGSLVIVLTNGKEINAGDVVPLNVTEKLKIVKSTSGTANSVLEAIEAINTAIASYGTMATQNANAVAITGGTINGATVGATTPAAGTFTTLTSPNLKSATGSATTGVSLDTPLGAQVTVIDIGDGTRPLRLNGGSAGSVASAGVTSPVGFLQLSASNSDVRTYTGGRGATLQFNVLHTASAVNYVQVTGAATGAKTSITSTGSDSSVGMLFNTKGSAFFEFQVASRRTFQVGYTTGTDANYLQANANAANSAPILSAQGSDTNIDLTLTPKGTGNVRFGTLTASADAPITGYITIKDSGGTVRKLAVIA